MLCADQGIGDEGGRRVADALITNKTLRKLNLNGKWVFESVVVLLRGVCAYAEAKHSALRGK